MMRARLERRVDAVRVLGQARVDDFAHSFTKRGSDGTGKGNITVAAGDVVHGVLYRLTLAQLEQLRRFEGGYRQIEVAAAHGDGVVHATTFQAFEPVGPLRPSVEYLAYYQRGMVEHGLPLAYRELVLDQARIA